MNPMFPKRNDEDKINSEEQHEKDKLIHVEYEEKGNISDIKNRMISMNLNPFEERPVIVHSESQNDVIKQDNDINEHNFVKLTKTD